MKFYSMNYYQIPFETAITAHQAILLLPLELSSNVTVILAFLCMVYCSGNIAQPAAYILLQAWKSHEREKLLGSLHAITSYGRY